MFKNVAYIEGSG